MNFRNIFALAVCFVFFAVSLASPTLAQDRDRVIRTTSSRPVNQPPLSSPAPAVNTLNSSRPVLANEPVIQKPLIEKTGSSSPVNAMSAIVARMSNYDTGVSGQMIKAIESRLGIRYRWGAEGPTSYDCSGFVWSVFKDSGFSFDRSSAAQYWREFEPVTGDNQFKFGTLVFFNGLSHVGIVADKDGFYQASSSKGITYSKFEGYWEKRITGFRRIPNMSMTTIDPTSVGK